MADNDGFEGQSDKSLDDALQKAHEKASKAGHGNKWLRVTKIEVNGPNAIRDYRVVIHP